MAQPEFIIIGGGPAGLSAAYELTRHGQRPLVLEKDRLVGGISRTESYRGYHFDMGGHRFFTKSDEVDRMWREVMLEDFLQRPRLSRIYYKNRFFNYPLKPLNALAGLGFIESVRIAASYCRWKLFPCKEERTFEQWVTNRFGRRLFQTFFKTYTEKVWGIGCDELGAEWAAQRIKDLSLRTAILSMFFRPGQTIKTLIESFDYPRRGPGQLWDAVRQRIEQRGGEVRLGSSVSRIHRDGMRITAVTTGAGPQAQHHTGTHFISSMPLTELIEKLDPPAPEAVRQAATKLRYRDFLTVCLIVNKPDLFPDNWIYIHDPRVLVGRIQNFKNWSPDMVPDASKTGLGLEYFCNEGDSLWSRSDQELIELAKSELERIGLASAADVEDGQVYRVPKSYPMYDGEYAGHLAVVREFVDQFTNCHTVGRNGLHRYNNQDHSMLTGMYAARNLLLGERNDLWSVNADAEYHEEVRSTASEPGRNRRRWLAPDQAAEQEQLALVFSRIDRVAMGIASGILTAAVLFFLTILLVLKGGPVVGPHLGLLAQYMPGYRVSVAGAFIGAGYGFLWGAGLGWLLAAVRNIVMFLHWVIIRRRTEHAALRHLLEVV